VPGKYVAGAALERPGLELFIRKVAYTANDATSLVRWSNYTSDSIASPGRIIDE
jgi:hypothetical protein